MRNPRPSRSPRPQPEPPTRRLAPATGGRQRPHTGPHTPAPPTELPPPEPPPPTRPRLPPPPEPPTRRPRRAGALLLVLAAVAAVVLVTVLLLGGGDDGGGEPRSFRDGVLAAMRPLLRANQEMKVRARWRRARATIPAACWRAPPPRRRRPSRLAPTSATCRQRPHASAAFAATRWRRSPASRPTSRSPRGCSAARCRAPRSRRSASAPTTLRTPSNCCTRCCPAPRAPSGAPLSSRRGRTSADGQRSLGLERRRRRRHRPARPHPDADRDPDGPPRRPPRRRRRPPLRPRPRRREGVQAEPLRTASRSPIFWSRATGSGSGRSAWIV